ncbi:MAG: two-component regulator propeller domain-containing protein, partial [Anaerolineae bacterium]
MKRVVFVIIFLFLIAISVHPTSAQEDDAPPPDGAPTPLSPVTHFAHLTTSDGLASAHVEVIFQDSRGFMWIGTRDGLNRYDGYHFTTYRDDPADPNSISDNTILDIIEDSQGRLWFATQNGLSTFDPRLEQFSPVSLGLVSSPGVFSLFEDSQGQV